MTGIEMIAAERKRQIEEKGWTLEHDRVAHGDGELLTRARDLAMVIDVGVSDQHPDPWGLIAKYEGDPIRALAVVGALVAAEIDRRLAEGES
jgi:hypothetical protein